MTVSKTIEFGIVSVNKTTNKTVELEHITVNRTTEFGNNRVWNYNNRVWGT